MAGNDEGQEAPLESTGLQRFVDSATARPAVLYPTALALMAAIGFLDYLTGDEVLLYIGHLLPVTLLAWGAGFYAGLAGAFLSAGVVLVTYVAAAGAFRTIHVWQAIVSFTASAVVAWAVAQLKSNQRRIVALLEAERRLAREDPLTGLSSARAFHERLTLELDRMQRLSRPLSLLYLDLDDFKRVNDERGHEAGDALLARVGRILESHVRRVDLCVRLGGDEFAVLMPETGAHDALVVAERVRDAMHTSFHEGGASISTSIGLATFVKPPIDAAAPLSLADGLMYEAKRSGKDRVSARTFP